MKKNKDQIKEMIEIHNLLKLNSEQWCALKLPKSGIQKAFGRKRALSPYDQLYDWIFKKIEQKDWMSVSDVFLVQEDADVLDDAVRSWLRSTFSISDVVAESRMPYYSFEMGPSIFNEKKDGSVPKWAKSGYVFVRVSRNETD